MRHNFRRGMLAAALALAAAPLVASHADGGGTTLYFHAGGSMSSVPPTGPIPMTSPIGEGDPNVAESPLLPHFAAPLNATITDVVVTFTVETDASSMLVSLFDGTGSADRPPVATVDVPISTAGSPVSVTATFPGLTATIHSRLIVQIDSRTPPVSGPRLHAPGVTMSRTSAGVLLYDGVPAPSSITYRTTKTAPSPDPINGAFTNYPEPYIPSGPIEASIGVDPRTDRVLFLASQHTLRATFGDAGRATSAGWDDVTFWPANAVASDPILWTDPATGRTFNLQLVGPTSSLAYTDDDGETWHTGEFPLTAPSLDHETIGGGPYHQPAPLGAALGYPDALYYCLQGVVVAQCARSDDGGSSWGAPVPVTDASTCSTLHGHVAVDQDGNVYLPFRDCGGRQAVAVSRDNGQTWSIVTIPGTIASSSDPKVAVDAAGQLYFVSSSGQRPMVSTSTDAGLTWQPPVDVGVSAGISNVEFPMDIAGDAGRAAIAFYGTATAGDDQSPDFPGVWYLYVAFTYDGGHSWRLVNATPGDPVQRGPICNTGAGCPAGVNLFDFQDMTIDHSGRVYVGYSDGCLTLCDEPGGTHNEDDYLGVIARQDTGVLLRSSPARP